MGIRNFGLGRLWYLTHLLKVRLGGSRSEYLYRLAGNRVGYQLLNGKYVTSEGRVVELQSLNPAPTSVFVKEGLCQKMNVSLANGGLVRHKD